MIKRLDPYRCPLPPETVSRVPRVICYGTGKAMVEQHRGILVCLKNEMAFQTTCGCLSIVGEDLELLQYTNERAVILGQIDGIQYGGGLLRGKH